MASDPGCRICITPHVHGVGGMVSFRRKLEQGLQKRGIGVCDDPLEPGYAALLVIGGTRRLWELRRARQQGVPVVQRLDGMNWLHRRSGMLGGGVRHYLRAEYGNLVLRLIRSRLATHIIYQSQFVLDWWNHTQRSLQTPGTVIYNGVDLDTYTPHGPEAPPDDCWRILLVEGSLMGGYEGGLETAVDLAVGLSHWAGAGRPVELKVAGRVSETLRTSCERRLRQAAPAARLVWASVVPAEQIPALDRSAHLLYSADINAACPNSAIEALACGLPVVGFATGALPELVQGDSGRLAAYGGDPWKLDPPDVAALCHAAVETLEGGPAFRRAARLHAEAEFGLDPMVERYLDVLLGSGG